MAVMKEENGKYYPLEDFVEQAYVGSRAEYEEMWKQSVNDPETFWGDIASELYWHKKWLTAVSYTHLRAHETPEHLVCPLLLEKKKYQFRLC